MGASSGTGVGPVVLVVALAAACAGPGPDTPSAVIELSPTTICAGDAHRTEVLVDGTDSSPHLSLVPTPPAPGEPPLRFAWTLSGAEHRVVTGSLEGPRFAVTSAGDRPLHVALVVTNGEGGTARHLRTLSITLNEPVACTTSSGCAAGQTCAADLRLCIPASACASDDDCPACFVCEAAAARCVPRSP